MTWNGNGNGQQQRKMPELGKGRLRKTREIKVDPNTGRQTSPDFNGLVNFEGQIISMSIWFNPATAAQNGQMMPESFAVRASRYNPQQGQGQQPVQQQMPYAPQQPQQAPVYAQPAPGPAYAPGPQPPQHGGYAPAPGYQPQGQPPQQAPQPPRWGGQPGQQAQPATMQAAGGYKVGDLPF